MLGRQLQEDQFPREQREGWAGGGGALDRHPWVIRGCPGSSSHRPRGLLRPTPPQGLPSGSRRAWASVCETPSYAAVTGHVWGHRHPTPAWERQVPGGGNGSANHSPAPGREWCSPSLANTSGPGGQLASLGKGRSAFQDKATPFWVFFS